MYTYFHFNQSLDFNFFSASETALVAAAEAMAIDNGRGKLTRLAGLGLVDCLKTSGPMAKPHTTKTYAMVSGV